MTTQNWNCNNMIFPIKITEIYDREDPSFYISKRDVEKMILFFIYLITRYDMIWCNYFGIMLPWNLKKLLSRFCLIECIVNTCLMVGLVVNEAYK